MTLSWSEERRSELREDLYTIARNLFRKQGFEATKVSDITSAARVSKGTFFNYFPAKHDVLQEWYQRISFEALETARAQHYATAVEAIVSLFTELATRANADLDLFAMKTRHVFNDGSLRDEEVRMDNEIQTFVREHVDAGKLRGELQSDLDSELCTAVVLSILTGTAHEWVVARQEFDLIKALTARVELLLRRASPA